MKPDKTQVVEAIKIILSEKERYSIREVVRIINSRGGRTTYSEVLRVIVEIIDRESKKQT